MSTSIETGQLLVLDPQDKRVITVDWDATGLPAGIEISTSTFTITAEKQGGLTALTKDSESIVSGNRKTKLRLIATTATEGDIYQVDNTILTNETPSQQFDRGFRVMVQGQ